ncbi:hypothetical protein Ddye_022754 [Dipteronia dyeriana]|uniref:Plastocyanin-like domain-containing protein n=1 Tax=Dipteronia dyeriana TaxID=168575 RepID=A0AAD9TRU1_9ROSI|nr:hypothetical protein Ddye_022754 [Dipteronia dyeriana]
MLGLNSTFDAILQNANALAVNVSEIHPWHLHGNNLWVLGYGEGKFSEKKDENKFKLKNPPLRNTVVIFRFGWTALRFVADIIQEFEHFIAILSLICIWVWV